MPFSIPARANATYLPQAKLHSRDIDMLEVAYGMEGVLSGCAVSQRGAGANMSVDVAVGQVRVGGYFPFVTAVTNVTITAADATNPRWDLISVDRNGALTATAGTAASNPTMPSIPANSIVLAAVYVPANATSIVNNQIIDKRIIIPNEFDGIDEFLAGSTETGEIGAQGWNTTASGTAANAQQAGEASHPGIWRAQSGTTSGNNSRIHLGNAVTTGILIPADVARLQFIVRVPTVTTVTMKVGLGQDVSVATAAQWGTAGAFFELDSASSANWRTITRQASASTTNTSGSAVTAGNWFVLEMVRLQNGNWQFAVNGTVIFTHSANLPTTACNIGLLVQTGTAAARNADIDFYGINFAPMSQRYT